MPFFSKINNFENIYKKLKMTLSKLVEYIKLWIMYDFKKCIRFVFELKYIFVYILGNDRQIYHVTAEFFGVLLG